MEFTKNYELILSEIAQACEAVEPMQVNDLAREILAAEKVFLVGVGRVLLSLMAFSKRLNHLGIKAFCVGDLNEPAITGKDLLIVGSGSGETAIPVNIAGIAKRYGAKVCHIGSNPDSSMKKYADLFVRIPVRTKLNLEDELNSKQMMSSMFEQALYVLCDSVCLMISQQKAIDIHNLWFLHANLE